MLFHKSLNCPMTCDMMCAVPVAVLQQMSNKVNPVFYQPRQDESLWRSGGIAPLILSLSDMSS
jgi:hypothetical protein